MSSKKESQFKVSVVEDDPFFLKLIAKHMEFIKEENKERGIDFDYSVYSSAQDFLADDLQDDDLVILDYYLDDEDGNAGMSGHELMNELKKVNEKAKVVFLSMLDEETEINDLKKDGAMMFIKKSDVSFQFLDAMVTTEVTKSQH